MVKNSGDTQARFLAKSLAFLLAGNCANGHESKSFFAADLRRCTQMPGSAQLEIIGYGREFPVVKKTGPPKNSRILSNAKMLGNLAAHNRPPFGFGARLFRNNCIDYRTGDKAFDATLG